MTLQQTNQYTQLLEEILKNDEKYRSQRNISGGAEEDVLDKNSYLAMFNAYFRDDYRNALIRHQLESYNYFINYGIGKIIENANSIKFLVETEKSDITTINKKIKFFEHSLELHNVRITKPSSALGYNDVRHSEYPNACRMRNSTYQANIYADFIHQIRFLDAEQNQIGTGIREFKKERLRIGGIPVMLHSELCSLKDLSERDLRVIAKEDPTDLGGYFIINGGEKVLISQVKKISNHVTFYANPKQQFPYVCEIKCTKEDTFGAPSTAAIYSDKKRKISFALNPGFAPNVKIPIFVMFKALGIIDDKLIIEYMTYNSQNDTLFNLLKPSIYDIAKKTEKTKEGEKNIIIQSQDDALEFIADEIRANKPSLFFSRGIKTDDRDKKIDYVLTIFNRHLYPHIKTNGRDMYMKAYLLGYMCNKLLLGMKGSIREDDRDNFSLKRVDTAGVLLSQLFYQSFSVFVQKLKENIRRETTNKNFKSGDLVNMLDRVIPDTEIESKHRKAFSTGEWAISRTSTSSGKQGVAQLLQRITPLNTISALRRIVTPSTANQKAKPEIRRLHNTHWGYIDCVETPEGQSIGMVLNMAMLTRITSSSDPKIIINFVSDMKEITPLKNLSPHEIGIYTKVFVNGDWFGCTNSGKYVVDSLRGYRRQLIINPSVTIVYDRKFNEIRIYTDAGRLIRPLFIVDKNKLKITPLIIDGLKSGNMQWDDLVKQQYIEYISVQESLYNCLIAMYPDDLEKNKYKYYTHCEIHPMTILGAAASLIPLCQHNQSPRNLFQCAQSKQALSIYALNYRERMDTMGHVLYYPERPYVSTCMSRLMKYDDIPAGQNIVVAIMSYTGYNQEDSIIFNQSAIDRGLFRSTYFKMYKEELKSNEDFRRPDKDDTSKYKTHFNYDKLQDDGFPAVNTHLNKDDIIIGKIRKLDNREQYGNFIYKDSSIPLKEREATIDAVVPDKNQDGNRFVKIRIRMERILTIGDKLASRHGQKGVIGMVYSEEDMPFTASGVRPAIIINPHAIPSRMTIAHMIECLMSKSCAINGRFADGTPFTDITIGEIAKDLESNGFDKYGCEQLYSGFNGMPIKALIFNGPTYYQRLKHIVQDKIHARSHGPVQLLTRQPIEGRAVNGGHRFGEMERDCCISHGLAGFLKERFMECSDGFDCWVDDQAGLIAVANPFEGTFYGKSTDNHTHITKIKIPYAMKQFIYECMTMCIVPRLIPESHVL